MALHRIRRGLDLPITGRPRQELSDGVTISHVAFLADDFHDLKPRIMVEVGDSVVRGQKLIEDRNIPGVFHTASASGRVAAVNRGARRALQSIVIEVSDSERRGRVSTEDSATFESFVPAGDRRPEQLEEAEIRALLVESGLWTAFRTRPFSKVPQPESSANAIFVTATDSNPLAPAPDLVLSGQHEEFQSGLRLIAKLTTGSTYLCLHDDSDLEKHIDAPVTFEYFRGPHPAGTAGLHIHLLEPVSRGRTVWTVGYQDVVAIGKLFLTGRLSVERVISIAGPPVTNPRLVRTRLGAAVSELTDKESVSAGTRWISGSVLSGKAATGDVFGYLGRYDLQLSALTEGGERKFMGWLAPGSKSFSTIPIFVSSLLRARDTGFEFTTDLNGSHRAMVPIGLYERVMPFDFVPTFLLRALAVDDVEQAERLGCLELDEEDLALCTFVDPGKADYGPILRRNLKRIEEEG